MHDHRLTKIGCCWGSFLKWTKCRMMIYWNLELFILFGRFWFYNWSKVNMIIKISIISNNSLLLKYIFLWILFSFFNVWRLLHLPLVIVLGATDGWYHIIYRHTHRDFKKPLGAPYNTCFYIYVISVHIS